MANFCTSCGTRLGAADRFCGTCGAQVAVHPPASGQRLITPTSVPVSPPQTRRRRSLSRRALIGYAIGGLLLCGVLGAIVDSDDEDEPARRAAVAQATSTVGPRTREATATRTPGTRPTTAGTPVALSGGQPTATAAPSATATGPARPTATRVPVVTADGLEYRVINASLGQSFGPPLNLEPLDDGRSYLVVSVEITNRGDSTRLDSDDVDAVVDGETINEAGDVVDEVAEGLGLKSMGDMIGTSLDRDESEVFVFVYKVPPTAASYELKLDEAGGRQIDLAPYLGGPDSLALLVPTATVTPTVGPRPTATRTPTPRLGSGDNPAPIGTTVVGGGMAVTVSNARFVREAGFVTPKGGYIFLVIDVRIENVDDESHGYTELRFSAIDYDTGAEFDDTIAFVDQPLGTGDLSPGEYVYGQVVLEVQETSQRVRIKYDTAAFGGENLYWLAIR